MNQTTQFTGLSPSLTQGMRDTNNASETRKSISVPLSETASTRSL
jgi:hypothetical protein